MNYLVVYLFIINILAFFVYGIDKWKAKKEKWRISESALLIWAVIGGSIGALLGMYFFRHKTKKNKFKIGVPLILVAQIVLIVCFLTN